ncbi:MAG: tRNA (N(6)-L-threonylcarbamoyladenosine(37)-C(2))-methylthiotransferase MtaB [Alphaproteobacteria bacterium]|nr:tRNA (N(6)-L-threonylcarbamoyladenosine(37)-C(2))-methylthiotransferase MtaB [Alphaproteobacteria bacterium]
MPAPPCTASPHMVTLGCRLNAHESAIMRGQAEAAGLGDAVIINSCAVTAEAERQSRKAVRQARREHPGARIIVTGCAAQLAPARYAAMAEADAVLGNAEKLRPESWRALAESGARRGHGPAPVRVSDIMAAPAITGAPAAAAAWAPSPRTRAFVQVQQGCDHRCTFCIIPFARGPARSVPLAGIIARARAHLDAGHAEIVLTGVDIASYGADLPGRPTLGAMLRALFAALPGLPRLRLTSLDPAAIDADLWRLVAEEPRLMPHLHLSVQAGEDMILKRMKRRHSRAHLLDIAARARALRPGIALGADLIAGFPTETEAMFASTLSLVDEAGLSFLHVFPYSERPGTPAARMPALPPAERQWRAARLREAGARAARAFYAGRVGTAADFLPERGGAGHTEHHAPFRLADPAMTAGLVPGRIRRVTITASDEQGLIGTLAD